ncbi:MAG: hypothetical protein KJO07_19125, partial [Deltaproteobacteria bacterium]|nr:hypothetical protein [Deltaproteobacteria bacterium]
MLCRRVMVLAVALTHLHADANADDDHRDVADPKQPHPASDLSSAEDVADAPRPNQASGVAVPADDSEPSPALGVSRALLFPPRLALEVGLLPVRATLYAVDRYGLIARLKLVLQGPSRFAV